MKTYLVRITAALILLSSLARLFFSVELTDESGFVAYAWTLLLDGGHLFHSELLVQQAAALFIVPAVYLYTALFELEGLVLFVRLLYFAWSCLAFWCAYLFLRKHYDRDRALIASSLYVAFIPFAVGSWSYNTISSLAIPMSVFLLLNGTTVSAVLAAAVATIACFCYPPVVLVYVFLAAGLLAGWAPVPARVKWIFLSSLVAGAAASGLFVFLVAGELIPKVLAVSKFFPWVGGREKVFLIFQTLWSGVENSYLWIFFALSPVLWFLRARLERFHVVVLGIAFIAAYFCAIAPHVSMGWLTYLPLIALVYFFVTRSTHEAVPGWWPFALAVGFAAYAVYGYSSSNILMNASLGAILPLQLLLLQSLGRSKAATISIFAFIATVLSFSNFAYVYRDVPVAGMTEQVSHGPYRFLFTHPERVALVEQLHDDLTQVANGRNSIFSSYFVPAYIQAPLVAVTGVQSVFENQWPESAMRLILYRTLEQDEWPDIVITKAASSQDFVYQFEQFFWSSGKYRVELTRPSYRILTRVK